MKLTIKEIEERLERIGDPSDPFFQQCRKDPRKGVQQLVKKWERRRALQVQTKEQFERMSSYEKKIRAAGFRFIAGIDEAGRGPLAGPVVAAAVILPDDFYLPGLNDSKQLTSRQRDFFYGKIIQSAVAWGIGVISAREIDRFNIYEATKMAMEQAIMQLSVMPDFLLIDAVKLDVGFPAVSLVKGDAKSVSIAAASIVAKVTRDRLMDRYAILYPRYQFEKNRGYGTREHLEALRQFGPSPIHRKTFAPVRECMDMGFFREREHT